MGVMIMIARILTASFACVMSHVASGRWRCIHMLRFHGGRDQQRARNQNGGDKPQSRKKRRSDHSVLYNSKFWVSLIIVQIVNGRALRVPS